MTSKAEQLVIFAPHVDDEVIGCYRLLVDGLVTDVYYFFDLDKVRMQEALRCGKFFGFKCHFSGPSLKIVNDDIMGKTVLIPNIADYHPHHRIVNRYVERLEWVETKFYSVDMNVEMDVLDKDVSDAKRIALQTLFPSQHRLFESTDKYHLFESLLDTDWITYLAASGAWLKMKPQRTL